MAGRYRFVIGDTDRAGYADPAQFTKLLKANRPVTPHYRATPISVGTFVAGRQNMRIPDFARTNGMQSKRGSDGVWSLVIKVKERVETCLFHPPPWYQSAVWPRKRLLFED